MDGYFRVEYVDSLFIPLLTYMHVYDHNLLYDADIIFDIKANVVQLFVNLQVITSNSVVT